MGGHQTGRPPLHDEGADAVGLVVAGVVGDDVQVLQAGVRHGPAEFVGGAHVGKAGQHDRHAVMAFRQRFLHGNYFLLHRNKHVLFYMV